MLQFCWYSFQMPCHAAEFLPALSAAWQLFSNYFDVASTLAQQLMGLSSLSPALSAAWQPLQLPWTASQHHDTAAAEQAAGAAAATTPGQAELSAAAYLHTASTP
jgi:hypothetical protein